MNLPRHKSRNPVFAKVPTLDSSHLRSTFNRSHGYKTTFNAGDLIPVFLDEALPGDTFNLNLSAFMRLATPIVPIMDQMYADFFFFAVPYRLVWDNFQRFMGEQVDPGDSTDYVIPQGDIPATGWPVGSLMDYFGVPTSVNFGVVSSLYSRAYRLIWNQFFRDQNMQDSVLVSRGDANDPVDYGLTVLKRGKRHDYFTSCLPFPQKGDPVSIGLAGSAPVVNPSLQNHPGGLPHASFYTIKISDSNFRTFRSVNTISSPNNVMGLLSSSGSHVPTPNENIAFGDADGSTDLTADLSGVSAISINDLRTAVALQHYLEANARGGTRYTELLQSHFGVVSPDARLQRPEYLGGGTAFINLTPVAQTSSTNTTTPQANLSAFGTGAVKGIGFVKSFVEHTIVIGLVSVRAEMSYQQGVNKMFTRKTIYDFYWPTFANLGEQPVLRKEIYATTNATDNNKVFGYQERWAEYRYKPSVITGKFRSSDPQSLDIWHLSQYFNAPPLLNEDFIVENPPIERCLAVQDEPQFLYDSVYTLMCTRPMPLYSVPGLNKL